MNLILSDDAKNCQLNSSLIQMDEGVRFVQIEPNLHWLFHGGRKGSTHYLIRVALEVHESLERFKMVKWIFRPIISLQGRHSKLRRQKARCDLCYEGRVSAMYQVVKRCCSSFHDIHHKIHPILCCLYLNLPSCIANFWFAKVVHFLFRSACWVCCSQPLLLHDNHSLTSDGCCALGGCWLRVVAFAVV